MPPSEAPTPPLPTLLSQPLVVFTIEFDNVAEERITATGPRPWIASLGMWPNYLRFVGAVGVSAGELRSRALVSETALRSRLGALRRCTRSPLAQIDTYRPRGLASKDASTRRLADVERQWREYFGGATVDRLRDALGDVLAARDGDAPLLARGLVPPAGGWRGRRPYLAQTTRTLRAPRGAHPHHPMVLHRGAFPDGS